MLKKYIVLGRKADGTDDVLAAPSLGDREQKTILEKNLRNKNYVEVQRFFLFPSSRTHRPVDMLKMEADIAANEKAAKEAAAKTKKAAPEKAAEEAKPE